MNLRKWFGVFLMLGLMLALNSMSVQADPYGPYYRGKGHGWKHHYDKHFRNCGKGSHHTHYVERVYGAPVAYVAPVTPVMGIPYAQPQPYYSQPAPRGFSGTLQYNF